MSTALRSVPLHLLSPFRELPPVPITLTNFDSLLASETPQSFSSVVSRATSLQFRSCCALAILLSCPDLCAVAHTTAFHAYSRERYRLILGRVIPVTNRGHHMRGTWTRRESISTYGKYFPRGSTPVSQHKIIAKLYLLVRMLSMLSWLGQCFLHHPSQFSCVANSCIIVCYEWFIAII
jgi:hypothetical protein